jgi:hypothetical protein
MRRFNTAIFLFAAALVLAVEPVHSSPADTGADEPNRVPLAVAQRIDAIQRELTSAKELPFWAGEYVQGDGLGTNVTLYVSPNTGVAFTNFGCLGLYGAEEGTVSIGVDQSLHFAFHENQRGPFDDFANDLLPVRWGERIYLLPRPRIYDFALTVNRGFEQLSKVGGGRFLNNKKAIHGMPELPEPYRSALRKKAVEAKVLRVTTTSTKLLGKPMCEIRYEVTIDHGASSGLSDGEMLAVVKPRTAFSDLRLEHVQSAEATGSMSILEDDCHHPEQVPTLAWTLSTYAFSEADASAKTPASHSGH